MSIDFLSVISNARNAAPTVDTKDVDAVVLSVLKDIYPFDGTQLGGSPEDLRNVIVGMIEQFGFWECAKVFDYAVQHRKDNQSPPETKSKPSQKGFLSAITPPPFGNVPVIAPPLFKVYVGPKEIPSEKTTVSIDPEGYSNIIAIQIEPEWQTLDYEEDVVVYLDDQVIEADVEYHSSANKLHINIESSDINSPATVNKAVVNSLQYKLIGYTRDPQRYVDEFEVHSDINIELSENPADAQYRPLYYKEDTRAFQSLIGEWLVDCFGKDKVNDKIERLDRLVEEVFEFLQATSYPFERIYTMARHVEDEKTPGNISKEMGGILTTLAAVCHVFKINMDHAAIKEYERISHPRNMRIIRQKQANKPVGDTLMKEYEEAKRQEFLSELKPKKANRDRSSRQKGMASND